MHWDTVKITSRWVSTCITVSTSSGCYWTNGKWQQTKSSTWETHRSRFTNSHVIWSSQSQPTELVKASRAPRPMQPHTHARPHANADAHTHHLLMKGNELHQDTCQMFLKITSESSSVRNTVGSYLRVYYKLIHATSFNTLTLVYQW